MDRDGEMPMDDPRENAGGSSWGNADGSSQGRTQMDRHGEMPMDDPRENTDGSSQ